MGYKKYINPVILTLSVLLFLVMNLTPGNLWALYSRPIMELLFVLGMVSIILLAGRRGG